MIAKSIVAVLPLVGFARAHGSFWHNSMFGFNVTATNSPQYGGRDNRPQAPLRHLPFSQWWMHGHLDQPPHPNDVFELPAGGTATTELACDKDATSWWPSGPGGNRQKDNDPCPGPPSKMIHTNGINDLGGCALAIAYKSDVNDVKPEDLVVFSVNHQCIWTRYTDFPVPAKMPPCPNGKCICAWLWQHREDAGGDEMYMNGFQCNVTGATSDTPIPQGKVPVRCAEDSSKCVKGPKQPIYWDQAEGNNMFDDIYKPPLYLDTYGFGNGAQNDLWDGVSDNSGSEAKGAPVAAPTSTTASTSVAAATSSSAAVQAAAPNTPATSPTQAAAASSSAPAPAASSSVAAQPAAPNTSAASSTQVAVTSAPAPAAATSSSVYAVTSSPAYQQPQSADPTTAPVSTQTQGGQGHRTCRPKKNKIKRSPRAYKESLSRHRRSRRAF